VTKRINDEVNNFIQGKYDGGGYKATELYENMAACAVYPEDGKWYRAIYRGDVDDKFRVRFADFGNEKSLKRNEMLPLAAFPEIPALHSVFKLPCLKPTEPPGKEINKLPIYKSKMLNTIYNNENKIYVGIKGVVSEDNEDKYLCSIYSEKFF